MPAPIQSLQRGFKILYFVADREGGCSVAEIAAGVGLLPITAYKLIRTLEAEKFLKRLGPPLRFSLGPSIHDLKQLDDGRIWITVSGQALLQAQRKLPEANFVLLQLADGNIYQRLAVQPEHFGRLIHLRQYQLHPYEKASSLLFLAYGSPGEKARFYTRHPFEKEGSSHWNSQTELERFLDSVRRKGWCQPEFSNEIYHRLASPVWSPSGSVLSAVGCFREKAKCTRAFKREMRTVCLATSDAITESLQSSERPALRESSGLDPQNEPQEPDAAP